MSIFLRTNKGILSDSVAFVETILLIGLDGSQILIDTNIAQSMDVDVRPTNSTVSIVSSDWSLKPLGKCKANLTVVTETSKK